MNKTIITEGQSLTDVALQELGSVAAVFDLADANNLRITDELAAGQTLIVPGSPAVRPELVAFYANRAHRINTGFEAVPASSVPDPTTPDFHHPDFDSNDFN